ncbi:MAG: hypothetical protein Q7S33_00845 [Nanoarchaeota archaeon]|nr:hypothetical protein [Nanoarchaeota archaeon]
MPNNDFEDGRKLEKLVNRIKGLHYLVNSSNDQWTSELNRTAIQNAWKEYSEIAEKYNVSNEEKENLKKIVKHYLG